MSNLDIRAFRPSSPRADSPYSSALILPRFSALFRPFFGPGWQVRPRTKHPIEAWIQTRSRPRNLAGSRPPWAHGSVTQRCSFTSFSPSSEVIESKQSARGFGRARTSRGFHKFADHERPLGAVGFAPRDAHRARSPDHRDGPGRLGTGTRDGAGEALRERRRAPKDFHGTTRRAA